MNDSGLLQSLIEKYDKQSNLITTIGVFVLVNIIVGVINIIAQYRLKNLEVKIHKKNIQETKRLELMHELYKKLDSLRTIFNDTVLLQTELKATYKFLNENALYFKEDENRIAVDCCDYFSTLLISYTNKDISKEKIFLANFKKEFNR